VAVVYIAVGSSGEDGSFGRAVNAVSGAVWGGAIFGFGCFIVLLGVIFMAGRAQDRPMSAKNKPLIVGGIAA
jgi:hypothetical protein